MDTFIRNLKAESGMDFMFTYGGHGLQRLGFNTIGNVSKEEVKTLFMQEMIANGVLVIASHNWCYAHNEADMERVKNAYRRTFEVFAKGKKEGSLQDLIKGRAVKATANVRAFG